MSKPNYGLDPPKVVARFILLGGGMFVAAAALVLMRHRLALSVWLGPPFICAGASFLLTGLLMIWGSKVGKLRLREQLLSSLPWRGDERVLDVGCGHGLMLIGAAKRLPRGKSVGVDLWQNEDQAANSHQATERNASLEGVLSRVEIRDGDARHLPFDEATFDVVLSSWALHNIYAQEERRRAL